MRESPDFVALIWWEGLLFVNSIHFVTCNAIHEHCNFYPSMIYINILVLQTSTSFSSTFRRLSTTFMKKENYKEGCEGVSFKDGKKRDRE